MSSCRSIHRRISGLVIVVFASVMIFETTRASGLTPRVQDAAVSPHPDAALLADRVAAVLQKSGPWGTDGAALIRQIRRNVATAAVVAPGVLESLPAELELLSAPYVGSDPHDRATDVVLREAPGRYFTLQQLRNRMIRGGMSAEELDAAAESLAGWIVLAASVPPLSSNEADRVRRELDEMFDHHVRPVQDAMRSRSLPDDMVATFDAEVEASRQEWRALIGTALVPGFYRLASHADAREASSLAEIQEFHWRSWAFHVQPTLDRLAGSDGSEPHEYALRGMTSLMNDTIENCLRATLKSPEYSAEAVAVNDRAKEKSFELARARRLAFETAQAETILASQRGEHRHSEVLAKRSMPAFQDLETLLAEGGVTIREGIVQLPPRLGHRLEEGRQGMRP